jgi:hypothetical protein
VTSEAHKRNPPGSERWGAKKKIVEISGEQAAEFEAAGIGAPAVYFQHVEYWGGNRERYYADADELARWREHRLHNQADAAHD